MPPATHGCWTLAAFLLAALAPLHPFAAPRHLSDVPQPAAGPAPASLQEGRLASEEGLKILSSKTDSTRD